MASPYDAQFDFSDSELELNNFGVFADYPYRLLGKNLPDSILNANPSIEVTQPLTLNTLKKFAIFSPATGIYDFSITTTIAGFNIVIVDTAQWTMTYNHHVTFHLSPVMTREAALNQFKGLVGSTGYEGLDPDLIGVALTDIFGNDLPVPSPLFYAMAAGGGWTYHEEPSGTSSAYGRESAGGMIFNLGLLKSFLKDNEKGATEWHFKVNFARQRDLQVMEFAAEAFETGERLSFPVSDKKRPTWDSWGPPESTHEFEDESGFQINQPERQARTANVTITLGHRDAQGNRVPPDVEIELDSGGGGEEG